MPDIISWILIILRKKGLQSNDKYDTMLGIRCVSVCGCQSENPFVCFGAKPPQRACARDLPRDQKDEGRKVQEKVSHQKAAAAAEISQDERAVKGRTRSVEGSRRDQSTELVSQGGEETSQWKSEKRLQGPVDLQMPGGLTREVSIAGGFVKVFARVHARASSQEHKMYKKCHIDFPSSCVWS